MIGTESGVSLMMSPCQHSQGSAPQLGNMTNDLIQKRGLLDRCLSRCEIFVDSLQLLIVAVYIDQR